MRPRLGEIAFQTPTLLQEALDAPRHVRRLGLEERGGLTKDPFALSQIVHRDAGGQGLDPAHAGGDGAFRDDLEETDVAGAPDVGAAAKLGREATIGVFAHGDDAHLVAVLFAEQRHGPGLDRLAGVHEARRDLGVAPDLGVDFGFDRSQLVGLDGFGMADIEAQPRGRHQRALLGDVLAQAAAQRGVQQVCRRMIGADRPPALAVHAQHHVGANPERPLFDAGHVDEQIIGLLLGVRDRQPHRRRRALGGGDDAAVAHLAAGLGVERCLVHDHRHVLAGPGLFDALAVNDKRLHMALDGFGLVTEEFAGADVVSGREPYRLGGRVARPGPGLARLGALAFHGGVEADLVDRNAAALERVLGQIEGKAVSVVKAERHLAR